MVVLLQPVMCKFDFIKCALINIYRVYQKGRSPRLSLNRNPVEQRHSRLTSYILRHLLCYDIVQFHCACLRTGIFYESTFKQKFPLRRPVVFSRTDILCSRANLVTNFFHCSMMRMDEDTRLHVACRAKGPISISQSLF